MSTERVAIVTGAGNGIGRACVEQLRADNHGIVAVDLTADSMARMAGDDDIVRVVGDVADPDTSDRAVEEAERRFGRLTASSSTRVSPAGVAWSTWTSSGPG